MQDEQIETLRRKHAELDAALEEEERRPMPDATVLQDLKRQKLALKDQIASLETP